MEQITTVGIDLAKNVFSLHGVDGAGRTVLRRTVRRDRLLETVAGLSPCLIGMEACSGAHEWGRRFERHGHTVRLMAPKFVAPYRKSGKNDGNDAEAICEAVSRPSMRFVPVKSTEQQALLTLHRVRQGFVVERTALINRLRGLLSEFGVVLPLRSVTVRRQATAAAEGLPELAQRAIGDLLEQMRVLDERIGGYDREIEAQARLSEPARRLMKIRGIGATTALAIVATVGDAREFKNGRQFAAWIGLVPGQYSTGGKPRLGHISKRGDAYLRNLLVQGARSVLHTAAAHQDRMSRWALELQPRRGYYRTLVAIANKNARIAWALLAKNETLR
ncbi:MAG: IS110 family transposase [Burkholderiales bacterium]